MQASQFQVQEHDLEKFRLIHTPVPDLQDGEILVSVERFAFTANNITYGIVGEKIGYWNFFPPANHNTLDVEPETKDSKWGIIPVWGMAKVVESRNLEIKVGERLYGYFPMGSHLVMKPGRIKQTRFIDEVSHRAALPPVYNSYARLDYEDDYNPSMDNERALLFPLYATSYCLYDFLLANNWFEASRSKDGQIIIPSASSKTAIGLAMALAGDSSDACPTIIGVTSQKNLKDVSALQLYDQIHPYGEGDKISPQRPSVIIDMSGNGKVLNQLHQHLADNMLYCSNVGLTHYEDNQMGADFIRDRSEMFFAPGHIQKRAKEWGAGIFEQKALAFWRKSAVKSRDWLSIKEHKATDHLSSIYEATLAGRVRANEGNMIVF